MDIRILEIQFSSPEYQRELALRTKILRAPLGLSFSPEALALEFKDIHLGAFTGEQLVGCLLLTPLKEGRVQMRQVAVEEELQGRGIGKILVETAEKLAREQGFTEMILHARESAVPFYRKAKYEVFGEQFIEVTLPHWEMRKSL